MSDIKDELRSLMIEKFGSVAAFSRAADLPATTVYNVLNRGITSASFETVNKIYDTLQIDWFSTEFDGPLKSKIKKPVTNSLVEVPVYGRVAAGKPVEMMESDFSFPVPNQIMKKHHRAFFLTVEGESMNRKIPNGSYALVDPDRREPIIDGNAYAVCVNGHSATIKRVKHLANGIELMPDSVDPTIKPIVFDYDDENAETVTVIGEVVWYSIPFDFEI